MMGGTEEVFRFQEGCVLFFDVISISGTNPEAIDNIKS